MIISEHGIDFCQLFPQGKGQLANKSLPCVVTGIGLKTVEYLHNSRVLFIIEASFVHTSSISTRYAIMSKYRPSAQVCVCVV